MPDVIVSSAVLWSKLSARIKGWRTLIVAGATGLIGLADVLGAVDLRPLVRVFVNGDEAAVGAVMTALALGFALLRMITTGPVGERETR
jgi:hypothetical protein